MKLRHVWAILGFAVAAQAGAATAVMKPSKAQEEAALWSARVLDRYRYKPEGQTAPAGKPVLDAWLDALDRDRTVLTQAEAAEFEAYRAQLDKTGGAPDLDVMFAIFDWFRPRMNELLLGAKAMLREPMDFTGAQRYRIGRADAPRAADGAALRALWRQRVMNDVLALRLAGVPENEIVPTLERRYDRQRARLDALTPSEVFQLAMNAWVGRQDPDGAYFAPRQAADAGKRAGQAEAGIGIVLRKKSELIEIHELAHDAAAARAAGLKPGDRIVGVAPAAGQPSVRVTGWQVDEVVDLLRGAPGSAVELEVLPAGAALDAPRTRLSVLRAKGEDLGPLPRSRIEAVQRAGVPVRIGVLQLPSFYRDFAAVHAGDKDFISLARDVGKYLEAYKRSGIDAVLLDLRNNGGGALLEASGLTGLFLPGAAVVQQRSYDGKVLVESAPSGAAAWSGPLAVLTDKGTGAGAEILVAALQDHGRALVLGDPSFGKSTMQMPISLDRFSPGTRLGDLALTVAQFFRVNGTTVEARGVLPDIVLQGAPDAGPAGMSRRGFLSPPLKALDVRPAATIATMLPDLKSRHVARTAADGRYQAMLAARAQVLAVLGREEVSLNEAERRRQRDAPPPPDVKTVQMGEALQVLTDMVELSRAAKP